MGQLARASRRDITHLSHGEAMKHLGWFLLLAAGFGLTTAGLMLWHDRGFAFAGMWRFDDGLHPLYLLIVGIAMIPPALGEIFLLEQRQDDG